MSMIFINGDLACDTFLIIGGTLITFVYFKRQNIHKGNYKMSVSVVLKHYLHRYLRWVSAHRYVVGKQNIVTVFV